MIFGIVKIVVSAVVGLFAFLVLALCASCIVAGKTDDIAEGSLAIYTPPKEKKQ